VHEHGDPEAPTLLALHGITDSGECWADLVERLGSSYRIVAPDALGHGQSDRFTAEELAAEDPTEAMYDAAESLLESLGPALVMGHSMGGGLAAALAARRPDLVRAVVLEDPVWLDVGGEPRKQRAAELAAFNAAMAADEETALAWCRANNPTWPESEYRPWARAKGAVQPEFVGSGAGVLHTPWREIAAAISPPALVITGDRGVILHDATLREVAALDNPALEVHVIAGAGHGIRREQGDAFHALVDPWLAAVSLPG
jgi:pimeloyl-ACP methyl ester carboxylesterase